SSVRQCETMSLQPAEERDTGAPGRIGETVSGYVRGGSGPGNIQGLPYLKPPYGKITAMNMNTGETLWYEPVGDTPPNVANNAALEGLEIENTGRNSHSHPFLTKTIMIYGEGTGGEPRLH